MALTKEAKNTAVEKVKTLLGSSKMTVVARYSGTTVKPLQQLRREARENGTTVLIVKNRLFKKAMESSGFTEAVETMPLTGQLMYAFNDQDEAAAAQVLANFAKTNPQVELVTGLNDQGQIVESADLAMLASLPGKDQLRAQLIGTLSAPMQSFTSVLAASNRSILYVLNARAGELT